MSFKPFTTGVLGLELSAQERAFIAGERPWGYILFARNIGSPGQVRDLCAALRDAGGRPDAPVLIDQEGGRVQRLRPPHWRNYKPAATLGSLYETDHDAGLRAAWLMGRLHAFDLQPLGIDVDCLPVLDTRTPQGHDAIGDRALGYMPEQVAKLGRSQAEGLMAGGVLPVVKHMPGQGRALVDSHADLPRISASLSDLKAQDFAPFAAMSDMPMGMTAHAIFETIDPDEPATTSATVIAEIIRGHIGFDGLLMSDDISMDALSGDYFDRSRRILAAGCDIVLHCHGIMEQLRDVARACPEAGAETQARSAAALARIAIDSSDEPACRAEFETLLSDLPLV